MIELERLTKVYPKSKSKALDGVSLEIGSGEFFGLLGPNGAGKTTLISILATLLLPTEGTVRVDGEVLTRQRLDIKRRLALITQHNSLRNDMTLDQILELQGRLYALPAEKIRSRGNELLAFCGLLEHRKKIVRKLSGGMKRKLMVCRALLTEPEILLLDEPTAGMDAISRRQMWGLLRQLNEQGLTILLTTHYIEEAQSLCNRVALMNGGKLNEIDTPAHLIENLGAYAIDETLPDGMHSRYFHERSEAIACLSSLTGQCTLRDTTLEDVFVEQIGKRLS